MKRIVLGLAAVGAVCALAAPASASKICIFRYTQQDTLCVDPNSVIGG
jgi:hypothetical protein